MPSDSIYIAFTFGLFFAWGAGRRRDVTMGGLAATVILSLCLAATGPAEPGGYANQAAELSMPVSLPNDGLPELVATRQMLFFIPFGVSEHNEPYSYNESNNYNEAHQYSEETGEQSPLDGRSAQLWVSGDRGQSWQFSVTVSMSRRGFLFRAKHDGEYWFLVRTVDPYSDLPGTLYDNRRSVPELRVLVDTQPPALHLDAWRGAGGQICARWAVDETYLKPASLEILYRTASRRQWQTVALDRRSGNSGRINPDHGPWAVNWYPSEGAKFVQIAPRWSIWPATRQLATHTST